MKETKMKKELRSFGMMILIILAGFIAYKFYKSKDISVYLVAAFAIITLLTFSFPFPLKPFYQAWMWLGKLLGKITSPIILFILYFLVLCPTAFLMKLFGKDPMKRRTASSYWIPKTTTTNPTQQF